MDAFKALGLSDQTLEALTRKGFTEPTPIQEATVPLLLSGESDVVGLAATGTGKTAAFGLPIVELAEPNAGFVQALVLCPTRELAVQVAREIGSLRGSKRLKVLTVYGGQPFGPQLKGLRDGSDVVVGTPGRVLDHLRRGSLDLSELTFFVLDEADEMLDMGFIDDIQEVMSAASPDKRSLLFSATMSRDVMRIAREFMREHEVVSVQGSEEKPLTEQYFHEVPEMSRFDALTRVIDCADDFYGLVFCRTKADVDEVAERLSSKGYPAEALHGDITQGRREKILGAFRKKRTQILVATDVAARGIDVPDLTHVINLGLPQDSESYVHRIGRTGRAGKTGTAVTIIAPREFGKLRWMSRAADVNLPKRRLPSGEDVVNARKSRIAAEAMACLESDNFTSCMDLAATLLEQGDPMEVLAAVLQQANGDRLDPASYTTIADPERSGGSGGLSGNVELFMAAGRGDGLSLQKLLDFIHEETGVFKSKIMDVRLFPKHTTFAAPARDAEVLLRHFKNSDGGRPLIRRDRSNGGPAPKRGGYQRGGYHRNKGRGNHRAA
ncbi:DEAD/DEAH box helicase [Desulfovibrio ferrophilus]|uniref:RNA helicase n=1 Tax=Desulfovibrio ferrophilus TaxID=241368 RepID=A0A2Z6AUG0_9BACT|nr:DEAD/DEAH box helicase [Desulfovibrio ferrophilus]BBD06826.1 DEAD/DEAH box helicase domain protein [Desulfovibrio ferrophilus]